MALPTEAVPAGPGRYRADVVIIGAGVAGLYAAITLARRADRALDVLVVDKGTTGQSGSSPWAQGGVAVALGPEDSPELHARDTIVAGDGLCDAAAVRTLTTEAPDCVADILQMGATFDRLQGREGSMDPADLHLAREGGMSVARSAHRADATGAEMMRVLRGEASPLVSRLAGTALALAHDDVGGITGVWALRPGGEMVVVEARAVLLATGGCGGLFAATTNQDGATGDGVAMAYRAGAAVRDTEFVQFHPTGLAVEGHWRFLLTEALRGAGATLHDVAGRRFMTAIHRDAELAPRHVVAKGILDQEDGAWLDATGIGVDMLEHEFPTVLHGVRDLGYDMATQRVPVTPAAHYMVGGVRTDLGGRTSLPGLYAAGEVASTGLHGANRKASNSLAEALVFGRRSAWTILADLPAAHGPVGALPPLVAAHHEPAVLVRLRDRLREVMLRDAGPARTAGSLTRAEAVIADVRARLGPPSADPTAIELDLATTAAGLIVSAALLRTESRGGHYRLDHPDADPAWAHRHLEHITPDQADSSRPAATFEGRPLDHRGAAPER
ncbi:MAG TPA: FAD-dependent oxidoreductase [Euzebya sp.]|nr:FAD-dependent oxidoreductase [Euzebya sp.]